MRSKTLLEALKMLKMQCLGHLMWKYQSLEKYMMLGIIAGARNKREAPYAGIEDI